MKTVEEVVETIREGEKIDRETQHAINEVEVEALEDSMRFTLSDAIRIGSKYGEQAEGWGDGDTMCALSAAYAASKAFHYV